MGRREENRQKTDRVLDLYNRFLLGETINKLQAAEEYGVNQRSIQRDIDSIRLYCSEKVVEGDSVADIKYDRSKHGYRLVTAKKFMLTNQEIFSIIKILLESRSLNKSEMSSVINKIMDAYLPPRDRKKMKELIGNEMFHYEEPRHKKELIEKVWELGSAIYSKKLTKLEYKKSNGNISNPVVQPLSIMCSEYYFYLIAYIDGCDKKYPQSPTIYRIDRIQDYQITKKSFTQPYRD